MSDKKINIKLEKSGYFIIAENILFDTYAPKIGTDAVYLYLFLRRIAGEKGEAKPSYDYIRKKTCWSMEKISRNLKILISEQSGQLIKKQKTQKSNVYIIKNVMAENMEYYHKTWQQKQSLKHHFPPKTSPSEPPLDGDVTPKKKSILRKPKGASFGNRNLHPSVTEGEDINIKDITYSVEQRVACDVKEKIKRGLLHTYCLWMRQHHWCENNKKFCLGIFNTLRRKTKEFEHNSKYYSIFMNVLKNEMVKEDGIAAEMRKIYNLPVRGPLKELIGAENAENR